MSMARRSDHRTVVVILGTLSVALGSTTGCDEKYFDDKLGVLDLSTTYPGGTVTDPAAGIPTDLPARTGYIEGQLAEIYDFGEVPAIRNVRGEPTGVRVMPMYFFFNEDGAPLFSRPMRELRDGTDWMKGGHDVLNANPKDFCEGIEPAPDPSHPCQVENAKQRGNSYALRARDRWADPNRGNSDDYQRPIIDLIRGDDDPPRAQYTGLWEIVEVTVPNDYQVDAIKSQKTLDQAIADGKFSKRATGKVINCPLIDERTAVGRGVTSRNVFFPRIELWYRRQLAFCFLGHGWEALGNGQGALYGAGQDDARLDTFDVVRTKVGGGTELSVTVGRVYDPATFTTNDNTGDIDIAKRFADNTLIEQRPLPHRATDPYTGYTPMRWAFLVPAPLDYVRATWKSVKDIDPSKALTEGIVNNVIVRGVAVPCSYPEENVKPFVDRDGFVRVRQCGKKVFQGPVDTGTVDPLGDPRCNAEKDPFNPKDRPLECNPDTCFCDAPFVGFGQACRTGVTNCSPLADKFAPYGYRCFPPGAGFCQRACSPFDSNPREGENEDKEAHELIDTRCGALPGFYCIGGLMTCLKFCNLNVSDPNQCSARLKVGDMERETHEGMICQNFGIGVCAWPDTYTPQPFTVPQ